MVRSKWLLPATALVLIGLATMTVAGDANLNKTTYLTFNRPVGLPGVTLGSGTYVFELPEPMTATDVVRVSSRDGSHVYFTGLTIPVDRPAGLPQSQMVSFAEAPSNAAQPIRIWWPLDSSTGRQFIYPKSR